MKKRLNILYKDTGDIWLEEDGEGKTQPCPENVQNQTSVPDIFIS